MRTQSLHNQLVDWRHDLHMNPQISFEEEYASNKVANLLKEFGIEVYQGIAKTGVVGVLKKGNIFRVPKKTYHTMLPISKYVIYHIESFDVKYIRVFN